MTEERAIEILELWKQGLRLNPYEVDEAFAMAIKALERQVPKKPILQTGNSVVHINKGNEPHEWRKEEWQDWVCPKCGGFVGQRFNVGNSVTVFIHDQCKSNYCNECGQAIDWGNEDD